MIDPAAVTILAGPSPVGTATTDAAQGHGGRDRHGRCGQLPGPRARTPRPARRGASSSGKNPAVEDVDDPAALDGVRTGVADPSTHGADGGLVPLVALVAGLLVSALAGCAIVLADASATDRRSPPSPDVWPPSARCRRPNRV